jgi:hypothetical protein
MSSDLQLGRDAARFARIGLGAVLIALALAVVGTVLLLLGKHKGNTAHGIGEMLDWLAIVPAMIGLALLVIGAVSRRTARRRPFA